MFVEWSWISTFYSASFPASANHSSKCNADNVPVPMANIEKLLNNKTLLVYKFTSNQVPDHSIHMLILNCVHFACSFLDMLLYALELLYEYCAKQKIIFKFPCKFVAFSLMKSKKKHPTNVLGMRVAPIIYRLLDCYVLFVCTEMCLAAELKSNTEIVPNTVWDLYLFSTKVLGAIAQNQIIHP